MYILGYSGIDGYLKYKNGHIVNLTLHESYVSQGMDAAAALLRNGEIIAASAEERFTGEKHTGTFPMHAIQACLDAAGIGMKDIDVVAHNFNYDQYKELFELNDYTSGLFHNALSTESQVNIFKKHFNIDVTAIFEAHDHHDTHAVYAFETSGYSSSLVIVADGLGEFTSISVYDASPDEMRLLKSYGPTSSLGMLYSAITDYLGFVTNSDEYKIMGMAAYGDPKPFKSFFENLVTLGDEGSIEIHHLIPAEIKSPLDRETYRYFKEWLSSQVFESRNPDAQVEQVHKDFTAALQERLNEAMVHLASYWQQKTKHNNLCLAGGVALNCVANAVIARQEIFKQLYIGPASADDGTSLGSALLSAKNRHILLDHKHHMEMPFYGPEITLDPLNKIIVENNLTVEELNTNDLLETVAREILDNKIIAWTQDNMEFGPRALGNRSILANPRDYTMRERLNTVTKQRESFRPFAPLVKEDAINDYFETIEGVVYKHMLVNADVRPVHRDNLQAVTHHDGTARVQSVNKKDLPLIWGLLDKVEERSGIPILLNTSYNLKSMPIVCYENDALQSFIDSDLDILVINNLLIRKTDKILC